MAVKRVVIVGGGGAGDAAAFALRKKGFDGEVVIFSADQNRPYDRPYLSKEFLRAEVELPKVFLHDEAEYSKQKSTSWCCASAARRDGFLVCLAWRTSTRFARFATVRGSARR